MKNGFSDIFTLNREQKKLFELIENKKSHIFVTGRAGTGKSYLLQYLKISSSKKMVVVAPTGVAALSIDGQTIHSLFLFPPEFLSEEKLQKDPLSKKAIALLRKVEAVVIDEISMVRADLMDAIDYRLREARGNQLPFGGAQIIMFGDPFQLAPVVNDAELHRYFAHNYGGQYFFNASVWGKTGVEIYELTEVLRQNDAEFKENLEKIRQGEVSEALLQKLNGRAIDRLPQDGVLTLATTNAIVGRINGMRLDRLKGKMFVYRAEVDGKISKSEFPTEERLELKEGAQVMFVKNDRERRWMNGNLGIVNSLTDEVIEVEVDGVSHVVTKEKWHKIKYYYNRKERKIEEEVVGTFIQYPLRLAWAVTIHKSQGQTYDSVIVDMGGGAFAHGQTYVALSRCRRMETLYLKKEIRHGDVLVDPLVKEFMKKARIVRV